MKTAWETQRERRAHAIPNFAKTAPGLPNFAFPLTVGLWNS